MWDHLNSAQLFMAKTKKEILIWSFHSRFEKQTINSGKGKHVHPRVIGYWWFDESRGPTFPLVTPPIPLIQQLPKKKKRKKETPLSYYHWAITAIHVDVLRCYEADCAAFEQEGSWPIALVISISHITWPFDLWEVRSVVVVRRVSEARCIWMMRRCSGHGRLNTECLCSIDRYRHLWVHYESWRSYIGLGATWCIWLGWCYSVAFEVCILYKYQPW